MTRAIKLHAIVFAWPGQGHINPMLRFSELLALEGCKVTFVHSQHNLHRVKKAAAPAASEAPSCDDEKMVRFVGIDDGLPQDHPRDLPALVQATDAHLQGGLVSAFEELVRKLLVLDRSHDQAAASCTSTFIVSDFFMSFTQDVANKFCIPRIGIFLQCAASFACHYLVCQGFRPLPEDPYLNAPQGVLPSTTKPNEMISFLQCYDRSDPVFDFMIRPFKNLHEPAWLLINTYYELEHEVMDYLQNADTKIKHLQCGGPLLPMSFNTSAGNSGSKYANESMWEEDHQCLEWLDSQALGSVIFVSFGSLCTLSAREVEEFALGLEDSMVPFLWVIRPGLMEDGGLPEGFKERVKERACFVSWAPQVRVLAHASVGGFLTHCGWNSVLEGIMMGVPLLGWSSFADQMLDARCIEDGWGVGLMLEKREEDGLVSRDEVQKKVRALILELPSSVKSNCARLKEAGAKASEARNSSLILPLINSLKKQIPLSPV